MKRKILDKLLQWKSSKKRMPLVLFGARQVGKTYALSEFGKLHYKNVVLVNLEANVMARQIFDGDLNPRRVVQMLETVAGVQILPGETLLVLDEIQACERALTSLKSFCEEAPEYHVAAAGSLLGVAINREKFSFPVGKVDELQMFPLDFEEFLWALGKVGLSEEIRAHFESNEKLETPLHELALECYRSYLVVGGMPASVLEYLDSGSFTNVPVVQNRIQSEYIADMAKYSSATTSVKVRACYNSIPAQLAKENHKFQYKVVQRGGSATIFGESIEWLKYAGMVLKCEAVSQGNIPVAVYANQSDFKLYMGDVGLLTMQSGMPQSLILSEINESNTFMGAIAENYVAVALASNGYPLYYWKNDNTAELDFILQQGENVVPVEVKKGNRTHAKSFSLFLKTYSPKYGIRISTKNFGMSEGVKSVPLYAIFCI